MAENWYRGTSILTHSEKWVCNKMHGTPFHPIQVAIYIYIQGGATSTTLAHAAESGPFSVPHECLPWATNLSCRNGSNKAERYMQKAPAETKAMKCNQRQRERSHTIILPHAPLNQCCFSQSGDLLASK